MQTEGAQAIELDTSALNQLRAFSDFATGSRFGNDTVAKIGAARQDSAVGLVVLADDKPRE